MSHPAFDGAKERVRKVYPEARVVPYGSTLFIAKSGDEILGHAASTAARAWWHAAQLVTENRGASPKAGTSEQPARPREDQNPQPQTGEA